MTHNGIPDLELPPSEEGKRDEYVRLVTTALREVSAFFRAAGFVVRSGEMVHTVRVFQDLASARGHLVSALDVRPEEIPDTFSGTVVGPVLYLVAPPAYRRIWLQLYPEWPWTEETYHGLIVHEGTHRAHELIALTNFGSPDAMGPPWFFEGLAVWCSRQFDGPEPLMTRAEIEELLEEDGQPTVSYPLYGRLVRSLAALFPLRLLLERASKPGFPASLWD
jgi:hypothetical protein